MKSLFSLITLAILTLTSIVPAVDASSSGYRTRNKRYPSYDTSAYQNYPSDTANRRDPQIIYIYQSVPSSGYGYAYYNPGYPGCNNSDIIIGGQAWASCNTLNSTQGSDNYSGWFFANDLMSSFVSPNGLGTRLEWQGKVLPSANWGDGPCANGYRLPTRGEWETAMNYARLNNTSITTLLNLSRNGGYRGYKDSNSDVRIENRTDTQASYWSSTMSYNGGYYPTIMRVGSVYQGYRLDGTYYSTSNSGYNWQYTDTGLELVSGTSSDLANVRCIRK